MFVTGKILAISKSHVNLLNTVIAFNCILSCLQPLLPNKFEIITNTSDPHLIIQLLAVSVSDDVLLGTMSVTEGRFLRDSLVKHTFGKRL